MLRTCTCTYTIYILVHVPQEMYIYNIHTCTCTSGGGGGCGGTEGRLIHSLSSCACCWRSSCSSLSSCSLCHLSSSSSSLWASGRWSNPTGRDIIGGPAERDWLELSTRNKCDSTVILNIHVHVSTECSVISSTCICMTIQTL